ncbi:hypothetical protein [Rhizobium sp. Leaf383]|uniref:hypothetical protein n=1 Tax=Rhizobium sp. Leaf383 TaxID=1736357 RepID=UPI000715F946|nr:hypothetical protein [Rhizobium sp. Leaf383]KQS86922.1 hypothetical protein ASG58_01345 [Rhizobium sp. Leaf383]
MTEKVTGEGLIKEHEQQEKLRLENEHFGEPGYDLTERAYMRLIACRLGRANRFMRHLRNAAYVIMVLLVIIAIRL